MHLQDQCVLLRIYGTSFYGSVLWNVNSEDFRILTRSWNIAIKILWDLPFQTHTKFIEPLSDLPHLQSMLHSRFIGFAKSLERRQEWKQGIGSGTKQNNERTRLTKYDEKPVLKTFTFGIEWMLPVISTKRNLVLPTAWILK